MSDRATDLFNQFAAQREAGERPDPAAVVASAGDEGATLAGMIAAYLAATPASAVSEDEVLAVATRPELEPPRPWAELLPDLRERTGTTRGELVKRLSEILGVTGSEQQVGGYVHELETGLLAPAGVRPAVVSALASVLAVPRGLLEASQRLTPEPPSLRSGAVFSRAALTDHAELRLAPDDAPSDPRVDDLFTGASDG